MALTGREIVGLEEVVYGVEDMDLARRFFADWGLKERAATNAKLVFEAVNGTRVVARPVDAPDLAPAIQAGSGVREIVWGVHKKTDLKKLADAVAKDRPVTKAKDGTIRFRDPMGLTVGFAVTRRRNPVARMKRDEFNTMTKIERLDRPAKFYDHAVPISLAHAVFNVPDLAQMEKFYVGRLKFGVSDYYFKDGKLRGIFMRCSTPGDHHTWFLMASPDGKPHLNHVAFEVRDIHEVFGGGLNLTRKGWPTEIGPGRHPISSAYFWYFKNPIGGAIEYCADEDRCTKKWKPRDFDSVPENFAEWALPQGISTHVVDIKERKAEA
jgi:catechol 2,3-dioxygenase-like lactoylglutathione lyase family enzyme